MDIFLNIWSIKFGEIALHWYWQSLNLAISMLTAIGAHVLSSFGDLPNLPITKLKTSPRFPTIWTLYDYQVQYMQQKNEN